MIDDIRALLGPDGAFASLCPGYEYRDEQILMAEAAADALVNKERLIVEAGTGVGKTVAYLVPAVLYARDGKPVIVSTHTIALQSQLLNKDIPLLQEVMEDHPFSAVLMKGRGNFLCRQEIDHASSLITFQGDPLFDRLKEWASESKTGDIQELDFQFPNWHEVCCNPDTCRRQECPYYLEQCFYYNMRRRAAKADIVVVNHSLFFSDLGIRNLDPQGAILPDYGAVIFDEAHHLEDVASSTFGVEFSDYRVPVLMNRLRKRRDLAVSEGEYGLVISANYALFDAFIGMPRQEFFFEELFQRTDRRVIESAAQELVGLLDGLSRQLAEQDTAGDPDLKERIGGYRKMITRASAEVTALFFGEMSGHFRWGERVTGSRFVKCCLHLSPVSVADLLKEALWSREESAVCTSATLSNSNTFHYFKTRLGVSEANELIVGSPFDFPRQSLVYVPKDLDQPSDTESYADAVSSRIEELLLASQGRAFLLFTSYRMLNSVFTRLVDRVPFRLLRQGEISNERLIAEFRDDPSTCLMGVHSFWEGVDVKGERLSLVVIDKLPFAVPDSPINKARCERIEEEGGNWFMDYAVPQAQIRLKQGFGRLIRTKIDRGVVAILDSRIHTKRYGKDFVRYLPRCKATACIEDVRAFFAPREMEQIPICPDE